MQTESDVISAVCAYLEVNEFQIKQRLSEQEQGDDIIAIRPGETVTNLFVEAKGETSSKTYSNRHGQPLTRAQIRSHVSRALYKASETLTKEIEKPNTKVGVAFPKTPIHEELVANVSVVLDRLGIGVFWVEDNSDVILEPSDWLNSS